MMLTAAAFCLRAGIVLTEPVHLAHSFPDAEPARFEMVQDIQIAQTMGENTVRTSTRTTQRMRTELIERRDDGNMVIENTVEAIRFSMTGPGVSMEYDSENPAHAARLADPSLASLACMNGVSVQLLMTPDGRVLDVPNFGELEAMLDAMEDPAVRAGAGQFVRRDSIIAMNEMNYKMLPEGPVEAGDDWRRSFEIPSQMGVIGMEMDLTLDRVVDDGGRRIAEISMRGGLDISPDAGLGLDIEIGESKITGLMRFDIEAGVVDSMDMTSEIRMDIFSPGSNTPMADSRIVQNIRIDSLDR